MTSKRRKPAKRKTATKKAVAKPKRKAKAPAPEAKSLLGYGIEILESIQDDLRAIKLHLVPAVDVERKPVDDSPAEDASVNTDDLGSEDPSKDEAFN